MIKIFINIKLDSLLLIIIIEIISDFKYLKKLCYYRQSLHTNEINPIT